MITSQKKTGFCVLIRHIDILIGPGKTRLNTNSQKPATLHTHAFS